MKTLISIATILLATSAFAAPPDKLAYGGASTPRTAPGAAAPAPGLNLDPLHLVTPANGSAVKADDSIFARIASLATQDFTNAAAESIAEPTVQDGNGYVCATAWQPLANIIKRHPNILTGQIADDIEARRLVIGAFGKICKVEACRTVASDEAAIAAKAASVLPVSLNLPAPINIFAKTCNDLPNIDLVAPPPAGAAATPAASPSPAPTAQ